MKVLLDLVQYRNAELDEHQSNHIHQQIGALSEHMGLLSSNSAANDVSAMTH
jgi:hypothetical protein